MHYKYKSKPFAHQKKALEMSWDKEVFAYFMEMGTGKSKVLIDNIAMLYNAGEINGALIVAPKGVYKNWFDGEIPTHMPDYIEKKVGLWRTKPDAPDLKPLFSTGAELHILIMNVEAFSTKKGMDFAKKFLSSHKTLMGIDESTTIKNPAAKPILIIFLVRLAVGVLIVVDSSTAIMVLCELINLVANFTPFSVDNASTFITKICNAVSISNKLSNFSCCVFVIFGCHNTDTFSI